MEKILTNAVMIIEGDKRSLFGEVVQDDRFEQGHHIRTTELIFWDKEKQRGITKSGTEYYVDKLYTIEEYKEYLSKNFDKEYGNSLLEFNHLI